MKGHKKSKRKPRKPASPNIGSHKPRAKVKLWRPAPRHFGVPVAAFAVIPKGRKGEPELLYDSEEDLSAPATLAQSPQQRLHDWHEELRRVEKMSGDIGFLNFFEAWDDVRQLSQTKDAIDRESRINSLWRMHPDAAEKLGLPKPPESNLSQSVRGAVVEQPEPVDATPAVTRMIERGKFCHQVIDEIKRIRNLCVGTGRGVAEIQTEHPKWAVWNVRESLSSEDRETFNHPNQWGSPVGYAKGILSKTCGVSAHTINSWVKAYRRFLRTKKR